MLRRSLRERESEDRAEDGVEEVGVAGADDVDVMMAGAGRRSETRLLR